MNHSPINWRYGAIAAVLLGVSVHSGSRQTLSAQSTELTLSVMSHLGGMAGAIDALDDVLYVAHSTAIRSLRVQPDGSAVESGSVDMQSAILALAAGSRSVVVWTESGAIQIVPIDGSGDLGNPIGQLELPVGIQVERLVLSERWLYVITKSDGLWSYSMTDRTGPVEVGRELYRVQGIKALAAEGDRAFVVLGSGSGFRVLSMATSPPKEIFRSDEPFPAVAVAISGPRLYVLGRDTGLMVLDATNPTFPILGSAVARPGANTALVVSGNNVLVGTSKAVRGEGGLVVFDVTDSSNPRERGAVVIPPGGKPGQLVVWGEQVVEFSLGQIKVVSVRDPDQPEVRLLLELFEQGKDVAVLGNKAYVAAGRAGIRVVNIGNPERISEARFVDLSEPMDWRYVTAIPGRLWAIGVEVIQGGGTLYPGSTLFTTEISGDGQTGLPAYLSLPGEILDVAPGTGLLWVCVREHTPSGWQLRTDGIGISPAGEPHREVRLPGCQFVSAVGGSVYLALNSNDVDSAVIGQYRSVNNEWSMIQEMTLTGRITDMATLNEDTVLAALDGGLGRVIKYSDIGGPHLQQDVDLGTEHPSRLSVAGHLVTASGQSSPGIVISEVDDTAWSLIARSNLTGVTQAVVRGNLVYVSHQDGFSILTGLPKSDPGKLLLPAVYRFPQ